jgi:hypothetical protein
MGGAFRVFCAPGLNSLSSLCSHISAEAARCERYFGRYFDAHWARSGLIALIALLAHIYLGRLAILAVNHGEKTNGDSLCSPSSNPSPERIDESVLRESPLEMSILPLPETAIVLE